MSDYNVANQEAPILDLQFVKGDSFSFSVTFPFDISSYGISAIIGGNNMNVTHDSNYKITLFISGATSANLSNHTTWLLRLSSGGYSRTYLKGKYLEA